MANLILKHWARWILRLFSEHLKKLIAGEEVQFPKYNFRTGFIGTG